MTDDVLAEMRSGAMWVTLNRPDALNAITPAVVDGINAALDRATSEGAHAIVLTGTGRAFCAGADLKYVHGESKSDTAGLNNFLETVLAVMDRIENFPAPVIAALNGLTLAGGLELMLSGESGEFNHAAMRLARYSSSQPAVLRRRTDGIFARSVAGVEIVGDMPAGCEISWGVVGSDAAFIVAKDHVHDPVQGVLDGPVRADHGADRGGWHRQRGDVEACLVGDLAVDLARLSTTTTAFRPGQMVDRLQPFNIVDHRIVSGLDTAVIRIDRFVRADRGIPVFQGFLLIGENLDILAQGSLIALQRDNVIGLFLDNFRGDVTAWQPIASIVTTAPSIDIMSSSAGMATISFDFSFTFTWPSAIRYQRGEGRDDVDRLFRALGLIRAPRRLAIDRDHLGGCVRQRRHPGHEAKLEGAGVKRGKDMAEMIVRGRAVYVGPKSPQQFDLPLAKSRDVGECLRPQEPPEESGAAPPAADNPLCWPDDDPATR